MIRISDQRAADILAVGASGCDSPDHDEDLANLAADLRDARRQTTLLEAECERLQGEIVGLRGSALSTRCDRLRADLDEALATIARKDEAIEQLRVALAGTVKP